MKLLPARRPAIAALLGLALAAATVGAAAQALKVGDAHQAATPSTRRLVGGPCTWLFM